MKPPYLLPPVAAALLLWQLQAAPPPKSTPAGEAVRSVMTAEESLRDVPLRDIVAAATGRQILPLLPDKQPADAACREHLRKAADAVLTFLNTPGSPVKGLRRINEASRHVEDKLVALLNEGDFSCDFPKTSTGSTQRSGYPDLRLVHKPTGRVYYLDPKLYEAKSAASTLRTFYYEPRELTGKIHDDACHLLLGIAHDGHDGAWKLTAWRLTDLYEFRVRLKAEFQASNKDLYREALTVSRSVQ